MVWMQVVRSAMGTLKSVLVRALGAIRASQRGGGKEGESGVAKAPGRSMRAHFDQLPTPSPRRTSGALAWHTEYRLHMVCVHCIVPSYASPWAWHQDPSAGGALGRTLARIQVHAHLGHSAAKLLP